MKILMPCLASAVLMATVAYADESPSSTDVEKDLIATWGPPVGRMESGENLFLFFSRATVSVTRGVVTECRLRDLELERAMEEKAARDKAQRLELARIEVEAREKEQQLELARIEAQNAENQRVLAAAGISKARTEADIFKSTYVSSPFIPVAYSSGSVYGFNPAAARACVTQANLAAVQDGSKVIVPNVDPSTGTFRSCEAPYKAVDRSLFQQSGAFVAAQATPSTTACAPCPVVCVPACPPPHRDGHARGFVVKIKL